jgi:trimeric autotransporter adhesin
VTNIAVWNGTNWSALGNPGGVVASILVHPTGLYVSGAPFYNASLYGSPFFSRWDGTNWQGALGFPPLTDTAFYFASSDFGMAALAAVDTNIFIGGRFSIGQYASTNPPSGYTNCDNITRFDGAYGWIVGSGLNSNVAAMTAVGSNLYVAGSFTVAGGMAASRIALWNGSHWTNLGSGLVGNGSINALATMGGNLYAGGTFTNMGGTPANRIAKWNGTNWSALGNGMTYPGQDSAPVVALAGAGADLFVGGTFRMAGNKASFYVARWNEESNFDLPEIGALPATNGLFRMRVSGIGGLTNIVQASTNFTEWLPILTNSGGIYDFADPDSSSHQFRFYRAVLDP